MVNNIFYFLRVHPTPAVHPRSYTVGTAAIVIKCDVSFYSIRPSAASIILSTTTTTLYIYIHV